jgi:DNA repair protein RadC
VDNGATGAHFSACAHPFPPGTVRAREALTPANPKEDYVLVRELRVRFRTRRTATQAAALLRDLIGAEVVEVFGLLCLSTAHDVIAYVEVSRGTLDSTIVYPRDVFRSAALANAAAIVLGHNHPSGRLVPSTDDVALTRRLAEAASLMGIQLVDHVIVGPDGGYFSFRESALL